MGNAIGIAIGIAITTAIGIVIGIAMGIAANDGVRAPHASTAGDDAAESMVSDK